MGFVELDGGPPSRDLGDDPATPLLISLVVTREQSSGTSSKIRATELGPPERNSSFSADDVSVAKKRPKARRPTPVSARHGPSGEVCLANLLTRGTSSPWRLAHGSTQRLSRSPALRVPKPRTDSHSRG